MTKKSAEPCYSPKLDEALSLVADEFRYRMRKGTTTPYLTHLLQVMVTVAEHGGDEEQLIAALLHDYLEDIEGASAQGLAERFGQPVVEMVVALSDATDAASKPPWRERKESYLAHLSSAPDRVKLISAADKLHNARSICRDLETIGGEVWRRFSPTPEQSLWYYRAVLAALGHRWSHPLLELLRVEVDRMHELAGAEADSA